MNKHLLTNLIIFAILIVVQILICNQIIVFGLAVVFIFIYPIINFKLDLSTSLLLTIAFFGGLIVDLCSDTLGVNALSCTLLATIKKPIFYAYIPKDDRIKSIIPTIKSLGFGNYSKYMFSLVLLYSLIAFSVEFLNFVSIINILKMTVSSAFLTYIILLGLDTLLDRK